MTKTKTALYAASLAVLLPFVALGVLDYVELSIATVTNGQQQTVSATLPAYGEVKAVHLEITPTAGTYTNTITLSTTADKGVSFADNAILTLTGHEGTDNAVYYPRQVADTSAGADVAATNGWYVPYFMLGDILKLTTTNTSNGSTNGVTVRVLFEDAD